MGCVSCCLSCISFLKCKDCVLRRIAFCPPKPSSYSLIDGMISLRTPKGHSRAHSFPWLTCETVILQTYKNNTIPALHFIHSDSDFTLIYSHGNSTDIGKLYNYMLDLGTYLKVSIFLYEYSGYGASTGKSSEIALDHDINAAYQYVSQSVPWKNIILFGNSLGSYPACKLASSVPVAGVILQSPIASGLAILYNDIEKKYENDVFNNLLFISAIKCPVFVIHGKLDDIVPWTHAQKIVSLLRIAYKPLWIDTGGHNNIEVDFRNVFLDKIRDFMSDVLIFQRSFGNLKELEENLTPCPLNSPISKISSKNTTSNLLDYTVFHEKKGKSEENYRIDQEL